MNVGSLRDFERFVLGEAKWTELPEARDAANLRSVAAQLPRGSVQRMAVVCRCAHPFPLGDGVEAIPLEEVVGAALPHGEDRAANARQS